MKKLFFGCVAMLVSPVIWADYLDYNPARPRQGDVFKVTIPREMVSDPNDAEIVYQNLTIAPMNQNGVFVGLIPISLHEKTGRKSFMLRYRKNGEMISKTYRFTVLARPYTTREFCNVVSSRGDQRVAERIISEEEHYYRVFAETSDHEYHSRQFWYPLGAMDITHGFGVRSVCHGVAGNYHSGVDLAGETGDRVQSPAPGVVVEARYAPTPGKYVIIDHGSGIRTSYIHLSRIDVTRGDSIPAGRQIGEVGTTGNSTGPHLHWEAAIHGVRVDPISLFQVFH